MNSGTPNWTGFAPNTSGYLSWRRGHGPSGEKRKNRLDNRTLAKDRAVLHRMFSIADRLELREGNPVSRVEPPKSDGRDPVILKPEEYERLLAEYQGHPMMALYILLLGETGCRAHSEGTWLRWEDVDLQEGFLWVASGRQGHRTKSGKGRWHRSREGDQAGRVARGVRPTRPSPPQGHDLAGRWTERGARERGAWPRRPPHNDGLHPSREGAPTLARGREARIW